MENLICKFKGHQFIKTADNKLYYVQTCVRCGIVKKIYYHPADANVKKVRLYK